MATLRARSSSSRGRHARSRLVPCERPPRRAETTASRRNRTARQRSVESHADRQPGGLSSSGIEALVRCGERKRIRAKRSDRQARVVATRLPALGRTRLPPCSASERPRRHPAGTRSGRRTGVSGDHRQTSAWAAEQEPSVGSSDNRWRRERVTPHGTLRAMRATTHVDGKAIRSSRLRHRGGEQYCAALGLRAFARASK